MLTTTHTQGSKNLVLDVQPAQGSKSGSLRIVHIATRFLTAGSEENTTLSCNWFAERGDEVVLIVGNDVSDVAVSRLCKSIKVIKVPSLRREINPFKDCQALIGLVFILRQLKPDIIHTHQSKAGILGRLASMATPDAVMVHGIHILPFAGVGWLKGALFSSIERSVAALTDAFVSVSPSLRAEALLKGIGKPERHFVVPSGMQLSRFSSQRDPGTLRSSLSNEIGVNLGERIIVVYIASYEPRKKHLEFLEVLAKEKNRFRNFCFVFAGGGKLADTIHVSIRKQDLTEIVHPIGYIDNVEDIIAASDFTMFCSEREGLPRALVQYCAAGKPIVAFDLPGIDSVLIDGENGFVCEQKDYAAMLNRMEQLALDLPLRQRMAASSARRNLSNWSVNSMCDQLADVYQTAMQHKMNSGGKKQNAD